MADGRRKLILYFRDDSSVAIRVIDPTQPEPDEDEDDLPDFVPTGQGEQDFGQALQILSDCIRSGHPRGEQWSRFFGDRIFKGTFIREAEKLIDRCFFGGDTKLKQGREVFLRFEGAGATLASQPWEYMCVPELTGGAVYWGADTRCTLVRMLGGASRGAAPDAAPRVLVLSSNLVNATKVWGGELARRIRKHLGESDAVEPAESRVVHVELEDESISEILARHDERFDIIHFVGHGQYNYKLKQGELLTPTDFGHASEALPDKQFAWQLCQDQAKIPRLVVLQACESAEVATDGVSGLTGVAPVLLQSGVAAVVGMQFLVSLQASDQFVDLMYQELLQRGHDLNAAVQRARLGLRATQMESAFGVPVLYVRSRDPLRFPKLRDETGGGAERPRPGDLPTTSTKERRPATADPADRRTTGERPPPTSPIAPATPGRPAIPGLDPLFPKDRR